MPRRESPLESEMLQGTLDMLVLRTLVLGPAHGHTIAHAIERGSGDVLQIEHGSLYPALQRMLKEGWVESETGISAKGRPTRIYRLTDAGIGHLGQELSSFERMFAGITRVLAVAKV